MDEEPPLPSEPQPAPPPRPARRSEREAMHAAWQSFVPVLWVIGLLLATSVAGSLWTVVMKDESPLAGAVLTGVDALIVLVFVQHEWPAVHGALRVRGLGWRSWAMAAAALVATAVVVETWFWLATKVFDEIDYLAPFHDHGWPAWSAVLLIVVCPAIVEELAFRGFLLERLEPLIGRRDALLLQATLFAIMHLSLGVLPSHFWMGLVLGALRVRTGSLVPGMCVHGAWNLYVLIAEGLFAAPV